jgi:hypothetical protein
MKSEGLTLADLQALIGETVWVAETNKLRNHRVEYICVKGRNSSGSRIVSVAFHSDHPDSIRSAPLEDVFTLKSEAITAFNTSLDGRKINPEPTP